MKRVLIAACVALACAVSLAAQTPATQDKPTATTSSQSSAGQSVTLKGCLKAGDTADSFVLANAAPASATTGTSGAAASAAAKTVKLTGSPAGTNLKDHVGHTVEITGTMASGSSMASGAAKSGETAATSGKEAPGAAGAASSKAASDAQTLNIKSIKHVEAKCGE